MAIQTHPEQLAFIRCRSRFSLAMCGAQSGKTIAGAPKFLSRFMRTVRTKRRSHSWLVDPTYELAGQAQEYLREAFKAIGCSFREKGRIGSSSVSMRFEVEDAVLDTKSCERPERLVAVPVDNMWINESATIKEAVWSGKLRSRLIATSGGGVLDTTPMGENWVYQEFYLRGLDPSHPDFRQSAVVDTASRCSPLRQYCTHAWKSIDNPAVDPDEVARARRELPEWAFRREYEGDPHNYSGMVYPDWDARRHVIAHALIPPRSTWEYCVVGTDWGYSEGHAGVMMVVARAKGAWWVVAEIREYQLPVEPFWLDHGRKLDRAHRPRTFWCDPSGGDSREGHKGSLWQLREAVRADVMGAVNDVEDGIRAVASAIKTNTLFVSDSCTGLIRELPNYRWAQTQDDRYKQAPRKVDDDSVDALRYAIASEVLGPSFTSA